MKRIILLALAVVSFSGRSAAMDASDAETQKPIRLEKVTVIASRLDLSPDPLVDYLVPKQRIVFEYLGHDVPGSAIMQAENLQDLKANWRPSYRSLDEFASSIAREGWRVAARRDLRDFYLVVFATPQGNLAGEYYAKTDEGRRLQRWGKILLFVSDRGLNQIVPDSGVFTLEQRMKYSVYVSSMMHGLFPANYSGFQPVSPGTNGGPTPQGSDLAIYSGWLIFHQGDLFMMPSGVKDFLFVFRGGATAGNSVEFSFAHWSRS